MGYSNFKYELVYSKLSDLTNATKIAPYSKSVHIDESKDNAIYIKVDTTIRFKGQESQYSYVYSIPYGQDLMNFLDVIPEIIHSSFGIHLGIVISLYDFRLNFLPTLYQIKEDLDSNPFVFRPE